MELIIPSVDINQLDGKLQIIIVIQNNDIRLEGNKVVCYEDDITGVCDISKTYNVDMDTILDIFNREIGKSIIQKYSEYVQINPHNLEILINLSELDNNLFSKILANSLDIMYRVIETLVLKIKYWRKVSGCNCLMVKWTLSKC